jgi:hypothetical protein
LTRDLGVPQAIALYVVAYHAVVVLVKFVLSPEALYRAAGSRDSSTRTASGTRRSSPPGGGLEYLGWVFSSGVSLVVALSLVGAISLASIAFRDSAARAEALGDAALLVSIFWVALAFLSLYPSSGSSTSSGCEPRRPTCSSQRWPSPRATLRRPPPTTSRTRPSTGSTTAATAWPLVTGEASPQDLRWLDLAAGAVALAAAVPLGWHALAIVGGSLVIGVASSLPPARLSYRTWLAPLALAAAYVLVPYGLGAIAADGRPSRQTVGW